jgi:class 3 adenylate cyclase/tetratricopeptide (TPR) repeat protein
MDSAPAQVLKTVDTAPLKPPDGSLPEESIKRMAVLFTDIVASSRFFQTFGDMAGRKMLKEHEEIASPPILEHGGVVVKMLGDSLMAYFFHPWEAVKAAIKIQKRLQEFNRGKNPQERIRVRIGVHFGEGILEEDDIFGDVVNMAAKFLPFVNGDEVGISHAVLEHIRSIATLRFETVTLPERESFPKGFHLYRVQWAEGVDLDPLTKTLILFRPVFAVGKASFRKAWERLLNERSRILWSGKEKEVVLPDQSLAVIIKDPSNSLSAAKSMVDYLQLNLGMDGQLYLPLQIVIDIGPFLRGNKMELEDLRVHWEELDPGSIYVSAPAYHILKSRGALPEIVQPPEEIPQPFYRVPTAGGERRENVLFLYQHAMIQGDLSPCFYCGGRNHTAERCPSKRLTEPTNAISKIGYLPLEKVNKLFFACLNEDGLASGPHHGDGADLCSPSFWAYYAFYELKSVYQLRLFRTAWSTREEDWNKVKEGKGEKNHGGLVWIAQDCIRVSNLTQAESILKESLGKEPEDYKPLCAMGFLHVERDNLSQAKFYFKKALDRCQTTPQRIMLLFLLSRVYQLQGDQVRGEDMIRRILRYNPHCAEAIYEDVLFQFRKGKEAIGLHQLVKLIKKNREYFVNAIIDPELSKHRELIHPKIKALLEETREEANKIVEKAREELLDLKRWLGDDERETTDAEALLSKIEELSKVNSFFSHLDILHYGTSLVGIGRSTLEERRRRISRILKELAERHERCSRYVRNFPYRFLVKSISEELALLHGLISTRWGGTESGEPSKFKDILQETEKLSTEMTDLEARLQRLELLRRLLLFMSRFLKKTLIFQSANLLVAIILFPIVTYYLNLLLPGLNIASHDIWLYQKSVLSLGSISGLLLALVTSGGDAGPKQALQR